jgi:hypothetical protein
LKGHRAFWVSGAQNQFSLLGDFSFWRVSQSPEQCEIRAYHLLSQCGVPVVVHSQYYLDLAPGNGQNPRSQIRIWGTKMSKTPEKILFWETPNRINAPGLNFDFEPLNTKWTLWDPKWSNAPGVKFECGSLPKSTNSPE